jgi:pheromone shutdown protein TraB
MGEVEDRIAKLEEALRELTASQHKLDEMEKSLLEQQEKRKRTTRERVMLATVGLFALLVAISFAGKGGEAEGYALDGWLIATVIFAFIGGAVGTQALRG